ncbi:MAG: hypothetical protein ABSF46_32555 [Terriglobia bacterium]
MDTEITALDGPIEEGARMTKAVRPKAQDPRGEQEFGTRVGKSGTRYLLVRTRRRGRDHFNIYAACQVTEACRDIVGDSEKTLRLDQLIDKAWGY